VPICEHPPASTRDPYPGDLDGTVASSHALGLCGCESGKGMYLILHGAEDESYPLTTVDRVIQELRASKVPFQLEVYSGTGHGFSTPKNGARERANAQSIASTARTLKELFGI
jgi:dienelactone hydrolase